MSGLILTKDQQAADEAFCNFILDPVDPVFVLEGFSGTGKSTLVRELLEKLPKLLKTRNLINPNNKIHWDIQLTATTNKAAEALALASGGAVCTIQSFLGLRVITDYKTRTSRLALKSNSEIVRDTIIFIDEASYIDRPLLGLIFERTENCKIVLIGDPAQLLSVGCTKPPAFNAGFTTARLSEVVRQARGNPIVDLSTAFRNTVNEGQFFSFKPDGTHIQYHPREVFEQKILEEFTDPTWHHNRSKVLAWTNKTVIAYNHGIRKQVAGIPEFHPWDYAVCNQYVSAGRHSIKTDQLVQITNIGPKSYEHDVPGHWFELDHHLTAFMPDSLAEKKARLNLAHRDKDYSIARVISDEWIDLRAAYACTINKSQGSTYDRVFIDLDDVKKCNSGDQIARMLYVAVSRARETVMLCGDIV